MKALILVEFFIVHCVTAPFEWWQERKKATNAAAS